MKPFDEKFAENVREAFDNYREPVDERAWNRMKSRLQAKSKKRIFAVTPLFVRAAAAITFLIAVSGSLWLLVLNPEKSDMEVTHGLHEGTTATPAEGSEDTSSVTTGQQDIMTAVSSGREDSIDQAGKRQPSVVAITIERPVEDEITAQTVAGEDLSTGKIEETRDTGVLRGTVSPGKTPGIPETTDNRYIAGTTPAPDMPEVADKRFIADAPVMPDAIEMADSQQVSDIREVPETRPSDGLPPLSAISGLYSRGVTSNLKSEQPATDIDAYIISRNLENLGEMRPGKHRSPVVEVSAGSMKTWSSGEIAGGMGYMAGVGSDWQIGRRLSIHGGGMLVYNRFSLQNTPVSPNRYSTRGRNFYSIPESDHAQMHPGSGIYPVYNVLSYQSVTSDIELTALDIPVNLRFTVIENPRYRIFMSAGFSSILYMQQKYRSESTVLASYYQINPQGHYESATGYANLISEVDFNAFSRFDPAGLLNLSAGYVIRRRNHALIVEPWLKYPSFDITSFNLYIGMAGLSLKYLPGSR